MLVITGRFAQTWPVIDRDVGDGMRKSGWIAAAAMVLAGTLATAQSFEDVMAAAEAQVGDIGKFQQALQNPDPRMQYALVQQMLAHTDPALQRIAKEHALFSTNPVMREAAIKAILDSGATLHMQIAAERDTVPGITEFVMRNGGTYPANQGQLLFPVPPVKAADCWGDQHKCILRQVGNTLQFTPHFSNRGPLSAVLNLGNDGVLRGTLSYNNAEFAQVQVDLKE